MEIAIIIFCGLIMGYATIIFISVLASLFTFFNENKNQNKRYTCSKGCDCRYPRE